VTRDRASGTPLTPDKHYIVVRGRLWRAVDAAKRGLGERGPAWWTDGGKDYNRCLVKNTPYASWFDAL